MQVNSKLFSTSAIGMTPRTICFIVPLLWIMKAHVSAKPCK